MSLSSWKFFVCLAALAFLVGCSKPSADVGATPVTGTVTLDGEPVEGASVAFAPQSAGGRAAAGLTDASGHFSLTTVQSGDGAMPGTYLVTISKTEGAAISVDMPKDVSSMTPEEGAAYLASVQEMQKASLEVTDLLPTKYKSPAESGLTAEVKQGEKNEFTFALTK